MLNNLLPTRLSVPFLIPTESEEAVPPALIPSALLEHHRGLRVQRGNALLLPELAEEEGCHRLPFIFAPRY